MANWLIFAVISAILFGSLTVLFKFILNRGFNSELLIAYVFSFASIAIWIYIFVMGKFAFPSKDLGFLILISALVMAAANFTLFISYKLVSNPSFPSAVQNSLAIVVVFLFSIFVFKLRPDLFGIMGVGLIISGVALLSRVV